MAELNLPNPFNTLKPFKNGHYYSLPALEENGIGKVSRLPVSVRIVLESLLRNYDGKKVREEDIISLANWSPTMNSASEVPFVVARVILQDFTGVPLVVDLAAMRDAVKALGKNPKMIEPLVPVDLVIDHSVQVDRARVNDAFNFNLDMEFRRNKERYEFLKWGQSAFDTFKVVPPAIGIVHQVNLEYLARVVFEEKGLYYPDSLVGTDSHTTMINGLGVVGWGVGGIEAEAAMLGQPVYIKMPEVVGVHLSGKLNEGVTATDLTLRITQMLREHGVVAKFVEFFGEGAASLSLADRATIGNMAPEYGATMGFFPVDEKTLEYMILTGRSMEDVSRVRDYFEAQKMFGIPRKDEVDYSVELNLDLTTIDPCVSGPKRPQDRINIPELKDKFEELFVADVKKGGYQKSSSERSRKVKIGTSEDTEVGHGSVLIAAITSCTNTSNPSVMVAAGLLAKNAVEKGLTVNPLVKASLAPGSRVVTDYLEEADLQRYLDELGFNLVGYGCTTCIGNSGPLDLNIDQAVRNADLITASVLSGNRNFEARIHPSIKANFLMSPPLVVAYALAGRIDLDITVEPLGYDKKGTPVYLRDIWPTEAEVNTIVESKVSPNMFKEKYAQIDDANPNWNSLEVKGSETYGWDDESTYIQKPPFFDDFNLEVGTIKPIEGMRPLALFGDSITTDHISPAGMIPKDSPAGKYLLDRGVEQKLFNSFGSRRGNDRVMTRGTFANVRIRNLLADGREGGWTKYIPTGEVMHIFDACQKYQDDRTPLIIFAGIDYGMGSSRDWAAKGTAILGVKVVVAKSFERIHRSNLIGMGVLPLEFREGEGIDTYNMDGSELVSIRDLSNDLKPNQEITLEVVRANGKIDHIPVVARIDTPIEVEYYRNGGILPYVLREILKES